MKNAMPHIVLATSLLTAASTPAQAADCACSGTFEAGDRVVALADNPSGADALPAGTAGTVICGSTVLQAILVRWDNWNLGNSFVTTICDCPTNPGVGTSGDWLVDCASIGLAVVNNVTQGTEYATIADGVADSNPGDVLELEARTYFEQGIVLNNKDITIRGQGPGLTIIDGGGITGALLTFRNGDESTVEGLTLQNGIATSLNGGGAARIESSNTSVIMRNCHFIGNGSTEESFGAVYVERAEATFDGCFFTGNISRSNGNGTAIGVLAGRLNALHCVFGDGVNGFSNVYVQTASDTPSVGRLVNCTFADPEIDIAYFRSRGEGTTAELINCVFGDQEAFRAFAGAIVSTARCVYSGATGNNIDGVPTFVDPANGNFRLAPGSLGIDAADTDAYLNAGGGDFDIDGTFRYWDDAGTFNTGTGPTNVLDCGAYEFMGTSPSQAACPGDIDGDGDTDLEDFTILASDFGCVPTP
ncbi:MAG: hypothetical protein AAFX05_02895 [Planctomycetota bacterium]